jgi:hypothetical protein
MIAEYIFPFGVSDITIKFAQEIEEKYLNDISILIEQFEAELNKNITNSSADIFNNSQVGMPAFVKAEFIEFIEQNIKYLNLSKEFKPFIADEEIKNIDDYLVIDWDSTSIIKTKPISINYNILNKYFIIDKINEYLIENKKLEYLITTDVIQSSFGRLKWKVNFKHENGLIHFKLQNQNALLVVIDGNKIKARPQKFANPDKGIISSRIIMLGEIHVCKLKVLSYMLKDLYFKYDYQKFEKDNQVELILLNDEGQVLDIRE